MLKLPSIAVGADGPPGLPSQNSRLIMLKTTEPESKTATSSELCAAPCCTVGEMHTADETLAPVAGAAAPLSTLGVQTRRYAASLRRRASAPLTTSAAIAQLSTAATDVPVASEPRKKWPSKAAAAVRALSRAAPTMKLQQQPQLLQPLGNKIWLRRRSMNDAPSQQEQQFPVQCCEADEAVTCGPSPTPSEPAEDFTTAPVPEALLHRDVPWPKGSKVSF
jgi:hypothetical protein